MKITKLNKKSVILQKPNGPEIYWKVTSPKLGGGSVRRFFKDESDANTYLEQQEIQLKNWGVAGASLDEKLRGDALAADEILKPFKASLRDAATFYANHLKNIQGGVTIADAVELFKKTRDIKKKSLPPSDGVERSKKEESEDYIYSQHYRKALAHYLKKFSEAFPNRTSRDITSSEIEAFLGDCGAVETIKTYRKTIRAMFNFLLDEGHCDKNPVRKSKSDEVAYSVEILTPEQCERLLSSCDDETLPSVAIGMFCGLRSSEIERLNWNKVNLVEKVIVLDAAVARKTGSRRVVPIHETCVQWLTPYAKTEGDIQPVDFRNKFDLVRVRAGYKPSFAERKDAALQALLTDAKNRKAKLLDWPSNCLRHSAISYAMADCGDQSKVASWAGNSPAMIKKHYDAQATPSQSKAFYSITPGTPDNQVEFKPEPAKPARKKAA